MEIAIWILHTLAAISMIGFILMQHGKGADMGAAFGSGSAGSLFGSSGSANFLSRMTAVLAVIFFATSLVLTYLSYHKTREGSIMEKVVTKTTLPITNSIPSAKSKVSPSLPVAKPEHTEVPK